MSIKVYFIAKEEIALHKDDILSLVDEERRNKALAYKNEDDVLRSLGVGYLYYKILGKTPSYDAKGHPFFEDGPYISLAHSGHYSAMAVADVAVGIDIEQIKQFPEKTKRFFDVLPNDEAYYGAWCRYEAFAKCIGLGLALPIRGIIPLDKDSCYNGKKYSFATELYDNYLIAIANEGEEQEIEISLLHYSI